MSILMKKPRIEEIADALGDAKKTLLSVLDGPGEYARFDLEKGPLPVGGAPLVRRSILSYKGREYPGVYLRTTLGSHFIEVSGKEECATYEVDEANRSLRKVDEPLSAEELRRVLGGGSGGGSGLPDGYAVDGSGNVTIAGALKANNNGDVEVNKNLVVDGNTLHLAGDLARIRSWIEGSFYKFRVEIKDRNFAGDYKMGLELQLGDTGLWYCYVGGYYRILTENKAEERYSKSRYQHTVTISGEGFEFCFTATSSKKLVVDSYQDLVSVFGGKRIGLTGYSHALSAKPVLIDLHGGSVSNDFIRVFEENGNTFANHTLASLGAITFSDDVYIPN